jgi:hypothetical protein
MIPFKLVVSPKVADVTRYQKESLLTQEDSLTRDDDDDDHTCRANLNGRTQNWVTSSSVLSIYFYCLRELWVVGEYVMMIQ